MTVKQRRLREVLPEGCSLFWYTIKKVLGRGAFGVTYLGRDMNLDQKVAIKEYFPVEYALRESGHTVAPITGEHRKMFQWGLNRFLDEARVLAKFRHTNIVRVYSVFEHNNTAYMVMEYEHGDTLAGLYKKKGRLSEKELLVIFLPILDGLRLVHQRGFLHRDVKPSNIFVRQDGTPVLIDFGAARQPMGRTDAVTNLVTYGYAPIEQYSDTNGKQGPWTDIYAFGASLYTGVTGKKPPEAMSRAASLVTNGKDPYEPLIDQDLTEYTPEFCRAIDSALQLRIDDRPQSLSEWLELLTATPSADKVAAGSRLSHKSSEERPDIPAKPHKVDKAGKGETVDKIESRRHTKRSEVNSTGTVKEKKALIENKERKQNTEMRAETKPQPVPPKPKRHHLLRNVVMDVALFGMLVVGGIYLIASTLTDDYQVKNLLQKADRVMQGRKLLEPEGQNAYAFYKKVLELDPENAEAKSRLDEIYSIYKKQVVLEIDNQNPGVARTKLDLLSNAFPTHPELPGLNKKVSMLEDDYSISRLLSLARIAESAGNLTMPDQASALYYYRQVMVIDADNPQAKRGIVYIKQHLSESALLAMNEQRFDTAKSLIQELARVDSKAAEQISKKWAQKRRN